MEYLAFGMALLPDLGYLEQDLPAAQPSPDGKQPKINAAHEKVFAEGAVGYARAARAEFLDALKA